MKAVSVSAVVFAATLLSAAAVRADDASPSFQPAGKGTLIIDLRISDVIPEDNDPIVTPAGAATGLRATVGDSVMPTLGFDYYLTNTLSVEAILGVTHHSLYAHAPSGTVTEVHDTWVLPPVITVKYHPFPKARISPYAGAGVNAMVYFAGADDNGFKVKMRDEFGYAVQFGADIALKGRWLLNLDAKKVFTNTRLNINDGTYYTHVGLSPWVGSVGLGYKF